MTAGHQAARIALLEYVALATIFVAISFTSHRLQRVTVDHQWDGASYEQLAQQSVDGARLTADKPFVYRIGWPWVVARLFPHDIPGGFRRLNILAAALGAVVMLWWLRAAGIGSSMVRLLLLALYLAAWQGPARFVYFYAAIIDPPLLLLLTAGLMLIHSAAARYRATTLALLTLTCFVGVFFRESMVLVPGCFLFVNNPIRLGQRPPARPGVPWPALFLPLAAAAAAMVIVRLLVVPAPGHFSFVAAVVEMLQHKPPFTVVLGLFLTFGPVLVVTVYDYRATFAFLLENQYLAAFLGADLLLAYIGGTDTERFLLWSAPVVYVLVGRSLWRHRAMLANRTLLAVLLVAQAVSTRIFLPVPDPAATGRELSAMPGLVEKLHGALNHLLGLDAFYFNLWSYFASGPWRLIQLAIYAAAAGVILLLMPRETARRHS